MRECTRGCVECRTCQVCALPSDFQFGAGVVGVRGARWAGRRVLVVVVVVVRYQIHKRLE